MKLFEETRSKYLAEILNPSRLTRICDIGANPVNSPPYKSFFDTGLCEVIGFEPGSEPFEALQKQKTDRETYIQAAVGDGSEQTLNICSNDALTSLLEPNVDFLNYMGVGRWHRQAKIVDTLPLKTKKLDDPEIPEFDLLKIDAQGAEAMVFEGGKKKLSSAVAVISEVAYVPLYTHQPLIGQQIESLQSICYIFHKQLHLPQKPMGSSKLNDLKLPQKLKRDQAIDGDAVFIREALSFESLKDEELKHMVLLADGVFFSFTLALRLLDELEKRDIVSSEQIDNYVDGLNSLNNR